MKLLFIAPIFFGYEKSIKKNLDTKYEKVIFRSEVPFNSNVKYYALRRFSKLLAQIVLNRYNRQLAQLVELEKIERIFIIRGYGLNEHFFQLIKTLVHPLEIFHYEWDSLFNNPNGKMISCYADHNFSFDYRDACANFQFKYLPLFYTWDAVSNRPDPSSFEQDIDLLFVGAYHSARHIIVGKVQVDCSKLGQTFKSHIYLSIASYLRDRLTTRSINRCDISFRKVSRKEYYELLCRSRIVLDIQNTAQSGATIRTFEALSLGRKLISTNLMLKRESFYSPNNIQLWNLDDPLDLTELLTKEFDHSMDSHVLNLEKWLHVIGI